MVGGPAVQSDEPSDAPKSPVGREFEALFFVGDWVIADDYEVLGLQVTVATVFGNCFGAYIFAGRFLGASSGVGAMFAHLM